MTPYRLVTFTLDGTDRPGLLVGDRVLDLLAATQQGHGGTAHGTPMDMRGVIEGWSPRVAARLQSMADAGLGNGSGTYALADVTLRTPLGRRVLALGSNPAGAVRLGMPVRRVRLGVFALTGLLAGLATLFSATQLRVFESGFGSGFELMVVASVVVGGTSIRGGRGSIVGTLLGATLLGIVGTVLIFLRLGDSASYWDRAVQGAFILAAVVADSVSRRRVA